MDKFFSENKKINVAHLIGSLGGGGAEQQVVQIVNHLDPLRFSKHVIVLWDVNTGFKDRLRKEVQYHSLQYRRRYMPVGLYKLANYLKKNRIDVLHSHMYDPNKIAALIGRIANIPVIVTSEHGKNPWKKWYHCFVEKHIISPLVDKRIAVSEDIRKIRINLDGVPFDQITTIANGVELSEYTADLNVAPKIIGSMGRFVEAKDYPTLFRAAQIVKQQGHNLRFKIAGNGPLEIYLKQQVTMLNLQDFVEFVGFIPSKIFLKQIDLFVMSSVREGMPVSLLEAMSYGLPVVVTEAGGILELIEHEKDGLRVPVQKPAKIAQSIIRLLNDKSLRINLGKMAKAKIQAKYDINIIANRIGALYIDLLATKNYKQRRLQF